MQKGVDYINTDIHTKNSVFVDCAISELDLGPQNTESQNNILNANTATNLNPPVEKLQMSNFWHSW